MKPQSILFRQLRFLNDLKVLILLLFVVASASAQDLKFGGNLSVKFAIAEKTYLSSGSWGTQLSSSEDKNFTAISLIGDITFDFNKYLAFVFELGGTFTTESYLQYSGIDIGFYYSTNRLFEQFYIKPGIYAHVSSPENPRFISKTITVASLGAGIRIFENASIESSLQLPITQSYAKDFFTEFKLKQIFSVGMKLLF